MDGQKERRRGHDFRTGACCKRELRGNYTWNISMKLSSIVKKGIVASHLSDEAVTSVPALKNIEILVHCAHTLLPMHANNVDRGGELFLLSRAILIFIASFEGHTERLHKLYANL